MSEPSPSPKRPDYGIDAPGAVRNLAIGGTAALLVAAIAFSFGSPLARPATGAGISCLLAAGWMVWGSKVEKVRGRDRILDYLPWRGDEAVLDVGCGRGLLLIGAAKRLTTGKAVGVDLWQSEDLSGNRPEATHENARLEGVSDRVEVKDGDARRLPFADSTFDVVLTEAALHNIYKKAERETAVREIARVLKPGGHVLIGDIRHTGQYIRVLRQSGLEDVRRSPETISSLLIAGVTLGFAYPAIVRAQKPAAAA